MSLFDTWMDGVRRRLLIMLDRILLQYPKTALEVEAYRDMPLKQRLAKCVLCTAHLRSFLWKSAIAGASMRAWSSEAHRDTLIFEAQQFRTWRDMCTQLDALASNDMGTLEAEGESGERILGILASDMLGTLELPIQLYIKAVAAQLPPLSILDACAEDFMMEDPQSARDVDRQLFLERGQKEGLLFEGRHGDNTCILKGSGVGFMLFRFFLDAYAEARRAPAPVIHKHFWYMEEALGHYLPHSTVGGQSGFPSTAYEYRVEDRVFRKPFFLAYVQGDHL